MKLVLDLVLFIFMIIDSFVTKVLKNFYTLHVLYTNILKLF